MPDVTLRAEPAKFSVLIPAYRAERYLQQALDTVGAQTEHSWEVIVVEDGLHNPAISAIVDRFRHAHPQYRNANRCYLNRKDIPID